MVTDEEHAFLPGPLDELAPGIRQRQGRLSAAVAHPRVCRTHTDEGDEVIVLASFAQPQSAAALHAALKPIVEAVLLHELTRPDGEPAAKAPSRVELYAFQAWSFDPARALDPLGMKPTELSRSRSRRALSLLRREAQLVDGLAVEEPVAAFAAPIAPVRSPLAMAAEAKLSSDPGGNIFGAEPGRIARRLSDTLRELGHDGVEPTRAGIERLEEVLVQATPDVIRFIPPVCFRGLCDLIAVAAHTTFRCDVQWAVCERDEDTGLSPPPLIRVSGRHGDGHVPLGEHVLRWCVMPRRGDEQIPSLGAWAEHEFGP